jgi:hypothetical protein
MSSLGGLRIADSLLYDRLVGGCGEGVPLGLDGSVALAALYASMKLSRVTACIGVAIVLMVGRVPELDVDAST